MRSAVDCSVNGIEAFRETLAKRLSEVGKVFSAEGGRKYGGMFGEIRALLLADLQVISEVADHSFELMRADLGRAGLVLDHDREMLERCREKIVDTRREIDRAREQVARDEEACRQRICEQTRANAAAPAKTGSGEEAERTYARMCRMYEENKAAAERAVRSAKSACAQSRSELESLNGREKRLCETEKHIQDCIRTLEDIVRQIENRRTETENYVTDCRRRMQALEQSFVRLAERYAAYEKTTRKLSETAGEAADILAELDRTLSAASGGKPAKSKRICVDDPARFAEMAGGLERGRAGLRGCGADLLGLCGRLNEMLRDEVSAGAIGECRRTCAETEAETADFEEKSGLFRRAARLADSYGKLAGRI